MARWTAGGVRGSLPRSRRKATGRRSYCQIPYRQLPAAAALRLRCLDLSFSPESRDAGAQRSQHYNTIPPPGDSKLFPSRGLMKPRLRLTRESRRVAAEVPIRSGICRSIKPCPRSRERDSGDTATEAQEKGGAQEEDGPLPPVRFPPVAAPREQGIRADSNSGEHPYVNSIAFK